MVRGVGLLIQGYGTKVTPEVEDIWRKRIQIGALLEVARKGTAQGQRAKEVALKLRATAKIHKKAHLSF